MKNRLWLAALLVCGMFCPAAGGARAADWFVDVTQTTNAPDGSEWALAFTNIQQAVDAAADGDVIWVADGVYFPITTSNRLMIIRSVNGAGQTFIEGGGSSRCATLGTNAVSTNTLLMGFTLQNGLAIGGTNYGGGSYGGTLVACVLTSNNTMLVNGGGAYAGVLNSCVLLGNDAWFGDGGGAYLSILNNCTLVGNSGGSGGGAASCTVNNSILWGNTATNGANHDASTLAFSCTTPLPEGVSDGGGNIEADPMFLDGFYLSVGSPCFGAGNTNLVAVDVDLSGAPLIQNGAVNQGARAGALSTALSLAPVYAELPASAAAELSFTVQTELAWTASTTDTWISLAAASGTGTGTVEYAVVENADAGSRTGSIRVATAYSNAVFTVVQARDPRDWFVDQAQTNGTPDGLTWPTAFREIQDAVVASMDGDAVWVADGIYAPISTAGRAITIQSLNGWEHTVLDGGGTNGCASLGTSGGTVLTGFTLRNGNAQSGGGANGGTLNQCRLLDNQASLFGGGAAYSTLNHCELAGNQATMYGGGAAYASLNQCWVSNNAAANGGGSYYSTLNQCIVAGNTAQSGGGGVFDCTLYNCTVVGNAAAANGGLQNPMQSAYNSILWGNTNLQGAVDNANAGRNFSCHIGTESDPQADSPQFVDWANGDFRLWQGSPCVNAGSTAYVTQPEDIFGNPMIQNGAVNQGAVAGWVATNETTNSATSTTPVPVPYAWLEINGLVTLPASDADYENAGFADEDRDGHAAWQEYVAGTDPADSNSVFRVFLEISNASPVVAYGPEAPEREYQIQGVALITNTTAWNINLPAAPTTHFYRATVRWTNMP